MSPTPAASAPDSSPTTGPPPTPASSAEPSGEGARGLVLSEVGFAHAGEPAFVELWNASLEPADVSGAGLAVDGAIVPLALGQEPLGADARLVVAFDAPTLDPSGFPSASPSTAPSFEAAAHAAQSAAPAVTGGTADLLDAFGRPLDHVAWGDEPDAVQTGLGGAVPDALDPAGTIGRAPGGWAPDDRLSWLPYDPGEGTLGRANPLPRVPITLPLDGAIFDGPVASLAWYPAPGATRYRVQVAVDDSFATPLVDVTVTDAAAETDPLPAGAYRWRVASIGADGSQADFTDPSGFRVGGLTGALPFDGDWLRDGVLTAAAVDEKALPVEMIYQHKDTPMLVLERGVSSGRHAWDLDHGVLDPNDPADRMNCVLASIAMLNHASGGDLSQDRIGYAVFSGRTPGPERDFNYGDGLDDREKVVAFDFAFAGATPTMTHPATSDALWALVTASIDRGVPLMAVKDTSPTATHAFVVTGYVAVLGNRAVYVNDPWKGPGTVLIPESGQPTPGGWDVWQLGVAARARRQEPTVNMDSDGDGVVDFDEIERFNTDPNLADTDLDDVLDKEEIYATVFDRTYGYAAHPSRGARDFDSDGRTMELDPDADDGGCEDGREDKNANGIRDPGESWNFEAGDDRCTGYSGSLTWTSHYAVGTDEAWNSIDEHLVVSVRLKPDPDDKERSFLDDGSTYSYAGRARGYVQGLAGCDDVTDVVRGGGGRFAAGDLSGGIVIEYEPGRDAFSLGARALWQGTGDHVNCLGDEPISESSSSSPNECLGFEDKNDGIPERTFVFSCTEKIGVGFAGNEWTVRGAITVH